MSDPLTSIRRLFTIGADQNGKGPVLYAWQKQGNYLACSGVNKRVNIFDRQGQLYEQLSLPGTGPVVSIDWDFSGEVVAIIQGGSDAVLMFTVTNKHKESLDTGMKDLTWIKWSLCSPILAVGTGKGNLLLYNRKTLKKIPIVGKHTKKIVCGAWSITNKLLLCSEDCSFTISEADEGNTLAHVTLRSVPLGAAFGDMKSKLPPARNDPKNRESTVAINLGESLYFYNMNNQGNPVEMKFSDLYGKLVEFKWFGDGYILGGFANGYVNVVSTHQDESADEVSSVWFHRDGGLQDVTYSKFLQKGASIAGNVVRVFDMADLTKLKVARDDRYELEPDVKLTSLHWTNEGQILTVGSKTGSVYAFLTRLPVLHDALGTRVLYLTSLREICVKDVSIGDADSVIASVGIDMEPAFVALGPAAVAVGMNATVSYYALDAESRTAKLLTQRTYARTVDAVKLSARHACVLSGGKVLVHALGGTKDDLADGAARQEITLPINADDGGVVKKICVTDRFLVYLTARNHVVHFSFDDWSIVNEYQFDRGIKNIWPNQSGSRVIVMDEANEGLVFNPVNDHYITIDNFSATTEEVIWDSADPGIFAGADGSSFTTYVYSHVSTWGPVAQAIRVEESDPPVLTPRPFGFSPVLCAKGTVVCQMPSGELCSVPLTTHKRLNATQVQSVEQLCATFWNHLSLLHLEDAYRIATRMTVVNSWNQLGEKALKVLDIDLALRVYRHLGQPTMVFALEKIANEAERSLLFAHVAVIYKQFADAQVNFLRSSRPRLALEMRRDLGHFDQALALCEKLAPEAIPELSLLHAQQLEDRAETSAALEGYERGIVEVDDEALARRDVHSLKQEDRVAHNRRCNAGITRCTLRLGQLRKGVQMALEHGAEALLSECAQILLELRQFADAAALMEAAGDFDGAAIVLIQNTKATPALAKLMKKVTTTRPWLELARVKEKEKAYREAEAAYENAGEVAEVIRLNADVLKDLAKAFRVTRETANPEGALIAAKQAQAVGDWATAVEFLLLAKQYAEGCELAATHDVMATYTSFLGENGSLEDYRNIAEYYEAKRDYELAGDFYVKCGPTFYEAGLTRYLKVGEACVRKAIAVVGKARDRRLTELLFTFLDQRREARDEERDASLPGPERLMFEAYIALGNVPKAAQWAVVVARHERESLGSYRNAHTLLFDMFKDLQAAGYPVTHDLRRHLLLVHSYIIVKTLNKIGDQEGAARMLIRVAKNINKFPLHTVPILTTAVIECLRANLKGSAYRFGTILVRAEYRKLIPEKFKKKIEGMIRKANPDEYVDPPEPTSPCPYCSTPVENTTLDCDACKERLPWCIVTGVHMVTDDFTACPACHFPALHSALTKVAEAGLNCPMCDAAVHASTVKKIDNPDPRKYCPCQGRGGPQSPNWRPLPLRGPSGRIATAPSPHPTAAFAGPEAEPASASPL